MYGWYSKTQKRISKEIMKKRAEYIYYLDMSDNIIEVTEVSRANECPSKFDDVVSLGLLKEFYKTSNEPITGNKNTNEFP